MLQKLWKCEVKAHSVEIQEINCHPILREINFGIIWASKIAIFTVSETHNFEFWLVYDRTEWFGRTFGGIWPNRFGRTFGQLGRTPVPQKYAIFTNKIEIFRQILSNFVNLI